VPIKIKLNCWEIETAKDLMGFKLNMKAEFSVAVFVFYYRNCMNVGSTASRIMHWAINCLSKFVIVMLVLIQTKNK
jgi:hypothetical protein